MPLKIVLLDDRPIVRAGLKQLLGVSDGPATGARGAKEPGLARLSTWLLGVALAMLIVVMLLPASSLAWLRAGEPLLGRPLNWLEALWPTGPDLGHVVPFAAMMLAWRLLQPGRPWWRGALVLAAVSVATELAQFLVPGRTPLVADVRDGVLGIAVGLVVAGLVIAMVRSLAKGLGRLSARVRQRLAARLARP